MAWNFCISGSAKAKAGANASTAYSPTNIDTWCDEAEAFICNTVRYDVISNSGSLTAHGFDMIAEIVSSMVGQKIINYDMSGFTSRNEAIMMLNVLENSIDRGLKVLKDDKNRTYLNIISI